MTKKIINQKEVAKKVFESLTKVDPNCILAGGAPRDWYYGKEARDLDFYFCSSARKVKEVLDQFKNAVNRYTQMILSELGEQKIDCWIAGGSIRDYFMGFD